MFMQRITPKSTLARISLSVFALTLVAFSANQRAQARTGGVQIFAWCVADGFCSAPSVGATCPGGVPGQPCETCQFQRSRMKCAFSLTQQCAWGDAIGTQADCGTRTVGVCLGGAGSACISQIPAGRCGRITCTAGGIL